MLQQNATVRGPGFRDPATGVMLKHNLRPGLVRRS
jgi:hypothetical protein